MSTETYTGASPRRARIRSITAASPSSWKSSEPITWKPSTRSSDRSVGRVQRAADADVQAVLGVEQALLAGPAERGAVGERGAEVGVPGVQVGVEVQHGDRAVVAVQRPQQRQRDGVVAAEGDQLGAAVAQLVGGPLDGGDRLGDVERVDRDVARVGHLLRGERLDVEPRVVGPQQLGRGADVAGPNRAPGR